MFDSDILKKATSNWIKDVKSHARVNWESTKGILAMIEWFMANLM